MTPSVRPALLLLLAAACSRPVAGRDVGDTFLTDLIVDPQYIRANVEVRLSFRAIGDQPAAVTFELGNGVVNECEPEREGDRLVCTHPGLTIGDYTQGNAIALVAATDDEGKRSVTTAPITIDFDCPQFLSLSVQPRIATVGDTAVLAIETNEPLLRAPAVSRAGRAWEQVMQRGPGSFSVTRPITASDPPSAEDIVVRIVDRAGNSSQECGIDGRAEFAVDLAAPAIDPGAVLVTRGAPGTPTIIEGGPRAFTDDVQIEEVRVIAADSGLVLARVTPEEDGSLEPTSLGGTSSSRVLVEAIDQLGQSTGMVTVPERWRLSLGTASTPNAGVKTAARRNAAPPRSTFLNNRTLELAPALLSEDASSARITARIGFEEAGQLPNSYEDVFWIAAGYDEIGSSIVTFGGQKLIEGNEDYQDRTLVLRWDDRQGRYQFTDGPPPQLGVTPAGRGAHRIAFDGTGCGVMFGGDGIRERGGEILGLGALNDVWRICRQENGAYRWRRITPVNENGNGFPLIRRTPIIWDPQFRRYVIAGGYSNAGGLFPIDGAMFLVPGATENDWRWDDITPLPTSFGDRHSHLLYYDHELGAAALGLGYVVPFSGSDTFWAYLGGQWTAAGTVPGYLDERQGFGYAYDRARRQLVIWGDNDFPFPNVNTQYLTGTATNATDGWRSTNLDPPVPRAHPTLVYDPNREATIAFGGLRFDERFVPPTIYSIISQPSYPHLAADVDLGAMQPPGITEMMIVVRAAGLGDADGVGPDVDIAGGVVVKLWDHVARAWVDVADADTDPEGDSETIMVRITDQPARFVSADGVVPVTVTTRWPGTEAVPAQLDVDLLDGWMTLRAGVTIPR
ncbi:MAG: hypothetical protein RIT81_03885 [Deltaproteobacteria bacterium]